MIRYMLLILALSSLSFSLEKVQKEMYGMIPVATTKTSLWVKYPGDEIHNIPEGAIPTVTMKLLTNGVKRENGRLWETGLRYDLPDKAFNLVYNMHTRQWSKTLYMGENCTGDSLRWAMEIAVLDIVVRTYHVRQSNNCKN